MKNKGFTLIEILIVIAVVGIFLAIIFGERPIREPVEYKVIESEVACIRGYEYSVIGENVRQIINNNGEGVRCQK